MWLARFIEGGKEFLQGFSGKGSQGKNVPRRQTCIPPAHAPDHECTTRVSGKGQNEREKTETQMERQDGLRLVKTHRIRDRQAGTQTMSSDISRQATAVMGEEREIEREREREIQRGSVRVSVRGRERERVCVCVCGCESVCRRKSVREREREME